MILGYETPSSTAETIRNFSISRSTLSVLIIKLNSSQSMRKTTLANVSHTVSYRSEVGENIQLTFHSSRRKLSPAEAMMMTEQDHLLLLYRYLIPTDSN